MSTTTRAQRPAAALPSLLLAYPRACWLLSSFLRALFRAFQSPRETQTQPWPLTLQTSRFDANRGRIQLVLSREKTACSSIEKIETFYRPSLIAPFLHTGPVTDLLNATGFHTRVWPFLVAIHRDRSPSSGPRTLQFRSLDAVACLLFLFIRSLFRFSSSFEVILSFSHPRHAVRRGLACSLYSACEKRSREEKGESERRGVSAKTGEVTGRETTRRRRRRRPKAQHAESMTAGRDWPEFAGLSRLARIGPLARVDAFFFFFSLS